MSQKTELKGHFAGILELSEQRDEINAKVNAERKSLRALGLTTTNINEGIRTLRADNFNRASEDRGRQMFRMAYGFPVEFPTPEPDPEVATADVVPIQPDEEPIDPAPDLGTAGAL